MACDFNDVVKGVLTGYMKTLSISILCGQVKRGLLQKSEFSYKLTFSELVVAVVLAVLGLVVVVVIRVVLVYVQIQCLNVKVTGCLWVCGVLDDGSISTVAGLTDMIICI
jgi:hypothetical protein